MSKGPDHIDRGGSSNSRAATVLGVITVKDKDAEVNVMDAAALDLSDPQSWAQMTLLLRAKFLAFLKDKFPQDSLKFEEGAISGKRSRELMDEFVIDQARIIGLRVLFSPTVLTELYRWSQRPELGGPLWRRFAKNIQDGLDRKRILVADPDIPFLRAGLIKDVKFLKRKLLGKKAAELPWDFGWHLKNLTFLLEQFPLEALEANATKFVAFVEGNEQLFKQWLFPGDNGHDNITNAKFVDKFMAEAYGYNSAESFRQASQKIKRSSTAKRSQKG